MTKNNKSNNNPLVSVTVITYNSSRYVLETLDSVKNQTYENLELIISDDCSTDNTVDISKHWIEENKNRFLRVEIITHPVNTGIAANKNRAFGQCTGEWIKGIAGDDNLLPSCIADNIEFALLDNYSIIFSKAQFINDNGEVKQTLISPDRFSKTNEFFGLDSKSQFLYLLIKNHPISAPTLFVRKEIIEKLGGLDESFPIEDFPFYLDATNSGFCLRYFDKETVQYRVHNKSYSIRARSNTAVSYWKKLRFRKIIKKYVTFSLLVKHPLIMSEYYNQYLFNELLILLGNRKSYKKRLKFFRYFSPLVIIDKFKRLNKKLN